MSELTKEGIEVPTKENVSELIERYKSKYIVNPTDIIASYNQENQIVDDYEGRQLLELIQNADDAKSDLLVIHLDTKNYRLSIGNNGEAFSIDGIESLMNPNISPKNKARSIGNKGLGFRSILNWANSVSIYTRNISFRFSKEFTEKYYLENLAIEPNVSERIEKHRAEHNLPQNIVPIATLAFPEILESKETGFITRIELNFKEDLLERIEKQIASISEESLLFLPHVKKIQIIKDEEKYRFFDKISDQDDKVKIKSDDGEKVWNIFRSGKLDYSPELKFEYAIAWQDNLANEEQRFYNYFPTSVKTNLPFLIHATFNLTNNRKEINDHEENIYILNKIATQLSELTQCKLKQSVSNWDAYRFLTPININNRDVLKGFYKEILNKREEIGVYPTVDGQYVKKDEVVWHGAEFSEWVEENGLGVYFPGLLKPIPEDISNLAIRGIYGYKRFSECIQQLNSKLTLEQRTALIGIMAINKNTYFNFVHTDNNKLPLLLNNKGEVVPSHIQVFTKNTEEDELEFPEFIKDIQFISQDLYNIISTTYKSEISKKKIEGETGDARAIQRFLKPVVNIGLNDITGVIQHIISVSNKEIKKNNEPINKVKQMVRSLYSIFKSNPDRKGNLTTIDKIPLLNRNQEIRNSTELYFGNDYLEEKNVEDIFEGIRTNNDYLVSSEIYGLEANPNELSSFFEWLNVNRFSRFKEKLEEFGRWNNDEYTNFVLLSNKEKQKDVYKNYKVKTIVGFEDILKDEQFSVEKLIAWILIDPQFKNQLGFNTSDEFYTTFNSRRTPYRPLSYLSYLINSSGILDNILATLPIKNLKGFKTVNYEDPLLSEYKKTEVDYIIDLLEIKSSFNDLNPETVYTILKENHTDYETNSQAFYKIVYEYFRHNEETKLKDFKPSFDGISYFCRKGGRGQEVSLISLTDEKIYYSDNKLLPQNILDNYWFINLPRRIGENKVQQFFGVNLIKDLTENIKTEINELNENLTKEMENYLNHIKPYWLSYRIESLKDEQDKKEAANRLKNLNLQIAIKASYKLSDNQSNELNNCDFISSKNDNSVIISCKSPTINEAKSDPEFCDVIAEIVCTVFKISENKNTFRRIFKDGVEESSHILKTDEKIDLLDEALKLLGVNTEKQEFWDKIFPGEGLKDISEENEFNAKIDELLKGKSRPENYNRVNFSDFNNVQGIEFLKWVNDNFEGISLEKLLPDNGLKSWHWRQMSNELNNLDATVKKSLWWQANEGGIELKKNFYQKYMDYTFALKDNEFDSFLNENKFNLFPEYEKEVKDYCKNNLSLETMIETDIDVKRFYQELFGKEENNFGSIEEMRKVLKDEMTSIYSLLYFQGKEIEDIIDETLKELANKSKQSKIAVNSNNNDEEYNLTASYGKMKTVDYKISNKSKRNGSNRKSVKQKDAQIKANRGLKSEEVVKKYFEHEGIEYRPISEDTEDFHCDFKYKNKGEDDWRYLEVKTDSGGFFFLSKSEKETGIEYKDRYDIAVVNGNHIQFFIEPFNLDESAEFKVTPNDYIVYFEIDNKEKKE